MGCDSTVDGLCLPLRLSVESLSCAKRTVPMPGLTFGFWRLAHEARAVAGGAMRTGSARVGVALYVCFESRAAPSGRY